MQGLIIGSKDWHYIGNTVKLNAPVFYWWCVNYNKTCKVRCIQIHTVRLRVCWMATGSILHNSLDSVQSFSST
jgi:hypothetical protein